MISIHKRIRDKHMYEDDYPLTSGVERKRIKIFFEKEIKKSINEYFRADL